MSEALATSVLDVLDRPSMIDFPGHLAAVCFVSGCNFRCGFCHNAALMGQPQPGLTWAELRRRCARLRDQWVDAVVVTGGEPTLAPDILELLRFFRREGFAVKLDTNGSRPDVLAQCRPLVDYVAMDVKAGPSGYAELTGHTDAAAIARSAALLRDHPGESELRTTLIEAFHDDAQLADMLALVRGAKRYVLQPFVPRDDLPSSAFREASRTSPERLRAAAAHFGEHVGELVVRGA